ncbi:uncharacterized protein At4g06744-like [Malania oleifera]|uniref:uncharacterized protein At4g06744-like n=1 Tax=Malania oleifera TaxID=397392 RepID=UPI0025AE37EC|nr:uncharacterized protein At4g06744-like [Malania oleifera]
MSTAFLFLITISLLHSPCYVHGANNMPAPALSPLSPSETPTDCEKILDATTKLSNNITYDPLNFTKTWVGLDYCAFKGYYCDMIPGEDGVGLAGVDFNNANFGGTLIFDSYIQNITLVSNIRVGSNNFSGEISSRISQLPNLFELDLSDNNFRGEFPSALLDCRNLTYLDLRFNYYSGSIPDELFDMGIEVLILNNNFFSGSISDNLGNTSAVYLNLARNNITGAIPESIGQAPNLEEVLFLENQLEGCLPYEVGFLSNLTAFDVGSNRMTGPIPQSFGCLANMIQLVLANNEFYGEVPETLCMLRSVTMLDLSGNFFTKVGSICRALIKAKKMNVTGNCISDLPGQRLQSDCANFAGNRKSCPYESTFSIVPCNISSPPEGVMSYIPPMEIAGGLPKRTYAALQRDQSIY